MADPLVYEDREEIGKAAKWVGDKVGDVAVIAKKAVGKVGDLFL